MIGLVRHFLLAALLLRALVPLGWMPGLAQLGEASWIICTADGQILHGVPGKDDAAGHHQQPCAFAAAHVMAPPQVHAFAEPQLQVSAPGYVPETVRVAPVAGFSDTAVLVALEHQ